MKVLFFTNIPSPYRVDFFNELGKLCDLTVLYERNDAEDRDASWLKRQEQMNYRSVFLQGMKVGADTALCLGVTRYWKDKCYDIRIVGDYATPTGILSIAFMKSRGIPYGIELDGGYIKTEGSIVAKIKRWLISGSQFAFSPGKITDNYLRHYGMRDQNIFRYPFTSLSREDLRKADLHITNKEQNRKSLGISEKRVVLAVGQMIHRKGFDVLIEAAKQIPSDVGIYIVGGKVPNEYLELVEIARLENIHFIEFMPKWDLARYYAAADIFVLPTRDDIWGLVVGEAMSFSLPVVTTNKCVSGLELVKDRGGAIVPAGDAAALSDAIQSLITNTDQMAVYGQNNRAVIENYTLEKMAQRHLQVLEIIKDNSKNGKKI